MRRAAPLVVLALLAACGVACSGGGLPDGLKVEGNVGRQPTVTIPGSGPDEKLAVKTLHTGKGTKVANGDLVVANYVGYRWNGGDHKLIASSYDSGQPAMFPYGHLVPGLNKALAGQRPGGRVIAVMATGERGTGNTQAGRPPLTAAETAGLAVDVRVMSAFDPSESCNGPDPACRDGGRPWWLDGPRPPGPEAERLPCEPAGRLP